MLRKLNILAFGAHPDDVELSCSGTLILEKEIGKKTGIADLTRGELGTRGSVETRAEESQRASEILGLDERCNLGLRDGFIQADPDSILEVIRVLRRYRPEIVLAPALSDRHPDHARAGDLVVQACFLAGLLRIDSTDFNDTAPQQPWRPAAIYRYIQDRMIKPDLVVDISDVMDQRMESILAYKSQFYNPDAERPNTYISSPEFLEGIRSRAREMGRLIGVANGEGFTAERTPGLSRISDLL